LHFDFYIVVNFVLIQVEIPLFKKGVTKEVEPGSQGYFIVRHIAICNRWD